MPPRNPDALAQAILRMLENPTRAKAMARAGRKRVEAQFSMAQKVQRTEALYRRLLEPRENPRDARATGSSPACCRTSGPTGRCSCWAACSPCWSSGAEAFIAWLVKPAMDDIFLKRDETMLKIIPLALLGAYLLKGVRPLRPVVPDGRRWASGSSPRIRRELYAHIQGMPLAFFASLHSAELMSRVVTDVNRLARLSSTVLVMAVRQVGTIVGAARRSCSLREWVLDPDRHRGLSPGGRRPSARSAASSTGSTSDRSRRSPS